MKEGYLIKKLGSIPKGWSEKKMPDFSWFQEGPGLRKWQFKDEGIKVINITNMVNGVLDLSKTTRHISLEEFNSTYTHFECQENDIVIASSGNSYCKHAIVRKQDLPLVMNTSVIRFKPLSSINYNYLNQFLKSQLFKEQIDFMITGGAQPNFGPVHLKKVVLALPPLPEQQKIADILSTVDAKINLITQRIAQTQDLKKGLMQRLLTKGIGHIAFKESPLGEIPKSWEVTPIYELRNKTDRYSFTGGPFGSDLKSEHYTETGVRIIQLQNIGEGVFVDKAKIYTSYEKADELVSCNIYPNDIILAKMAPVARCCKMPFLDKRYVMGSDGIRLSVDKSKYDNEFIYQALNSRKFRNEAEAKSTGTTRARIGLKDLKLIPIAIPPKEEQTQIANILSTVDSKLDVLQNKKIHYQELKKGLMQQLLTGKVRVTGLIKEVV
ncbi:restriction endonuclease subunit S [Tenacibaculum sp. AHE15PA]|uniref:restriction endonuclease subunit S n=1 Tax=unclassified Tenacibaculum TaxID=2635139 RepID=UPI001C4F007B|nr:MULTISPECIES: restriction endonuclease subunit S [unclassified Tenacibaculum]QXP72898.1 restriction endonuclease subunit S [Tenacibaculum sp. AHE14PA]QXP76812.1 restriction endonuclease subunit S [Tenacibaculum sp. AHE15PA]